ncbi:hypothetical protein KUV51_08890 [Tateyamaria omphalii]|uniref:hypothetical protein n=1 Tax=Tateyamaria omphalii TaxID=299262 RepID=UPI001C98EC00|nr:hypothetical protein [Tateyamaria omphalii]MBY5933109.1 hypothetical protein [Tateyamaria omphalii]
MKPNSSEYTFVRDVQVLEKSERLSLEDAFAKHKGTASKPSLAQFKIWYGLVGATEKDVRTRIEAELEQSALQRIIGWIRAFFSSGLLFVVLGIALIAWADHAQDESHTAFTFVYVVLGIAISLYGTGTQAAGSMRSDLLTNGWFQGSMAGGAGVLAFLAGWAIVEKHAEMRQAFDQQTKYLKVSFEIGSRDKTIAISPDEHVLSAYLEGLPVLTSTLEDQFIVLLPKQANSDRCAFPVHLEFAGRDGTQLLMDNAFHFVVDPECEEAPTQGAMSETVLVDLTPRERAGADFDEYVATRTVEFEQRLIAAAPRADQPVTVGQNDISLGAFE